MLTREEEVWMRTYLAWPPRAGQTREYQQAEDMANETLKRFLKRFPATLETDYRGNPVAPAPTFDVLPGDPYAT